MEWCPLRKLIEAMTANYLLKFAFVLWWSGSLSLRLFSSCSERGYSMVVGSGLLIVVGPLVVKHGLGGAQSLVVVAYRLSSCSSWALEHRLNSCGAWV